MLSRAGWGCFTVDIDIKFKVWTLLKPMKIKHELSFEDKGKSTDFLVEIDDNLIKENLEDPIIKQMLPDIGKEEEK